MTAPLVFLDTETTSLAANRRAWEVAMIRVEPDDVDGIGRGVSFFVSDVDLKYADPKALAVGRFYQRHPRFIDDPRDPRDPRPSPLAELHRRGEMRSEYQAAVTVERWTRDAVIVGSNPGFDVDVLAAMLRRHDLVPAWHYRPIDVATLAAGYLHGMVAGLTPRYVVGVEQSEVTDTMRAARLARIAETLPVDAPRSPVDTPWSSEGLSRAVGLPPAPESERHTAMGDARWVQRLYNLITVSRVIPALPAAEPAGGES